MRSVPVAALAATVVLLALAAPATASAATADLSVTKAAPATVVAGKNLTYHITVANAGPDAAQVSLTDALPSGTTFVSADQGSGPVLSCATPGGGDAGGTVGCANAALPAGASSEIVVTVHVVPGTAAGTSISNTASVSTTDLDPNGGNNASTATTTVTTSADLVTTIAATPDPVTVGDDLTYTVAVAQNGPSTAQSPSLALTLPATAAFRSLVAPGGWTCATPAVDALGGTATCTLASLPTGTSTFALVVRPASDPPGGTVSLTAAASSATTDPSPADATATRTTTVTPAPPPPPPPPAPLGPALFRPTVVSVSPASGPPGTPVTIAGAGFAATSRVLFGSTPAAAFVVDGYGRITAVAPARLPGPVDVRVVNPLGASPLAAGARFTVLEPPAPRAVTRPAAKPADTCAAPRLVGRGLRGARRALRRHGCHVRLRHRGHGRRVRAQRPAAGTVLRRGDRVVVRMGRRARAA